MRAALRDHLPHAARCGRKALLFRQQQLAWFARDCCQPARFAAHDSQKPATGVRAQEPRQQRGSQQFNLSFIRFSYSIGLPSRGARSPAPAAHSPRA